MIRTTEQLKAWLANQPPTNYTPGPITAGKIGRYHESLRCVMVPDEVWKKGLEEKMSNVAIDPSQIHRHPDDVPEGSVFLCSYPSVPYHRSIFKNRDVHVAFYSQGSVFAVAGRHPVYLAVDVFADETTMQMIQKGNAAYAMKQFLENPSGDDPEKMDALAEYAKQKMIIREFSQGNEQGLPEPEDA